MTRCNYNVQVLLLADVSEETTPWQAGTSNWSAICVRPI